MSERFALRVSGRGFAPWLTACLIARFGCPPEHVSVKAEPETSRKILLWPSSMKLLSALGLPEAQLRTLGVASAQWGRDFGLELPVDEPGKSGIRVNAELLEQRLKEISQQVGIGRGKSKPKLHIATSPEDGPNDVIRLGSAVSSLLSHSEIEALAVSEAASALAFAVPGDNAAPVEIAEMRRRASQAVPNLKDMICLVAEEDPSDALRHQISVWQALGHLCARDHDPFHADVWRAALSQRFGEPKAQPLYKETQFA